MSMSDVEISNCNFLEDKISFEKAAMLSTNTKGNFMHIVMSVNLVVKNSNFVNGVAN